jgi:hypothetical protein
MTTKNSSSKSESSVTSEVRLALQKLGVVLFRNNVGRLRDAFGRWVSFGLGVGSSDWIGLTPYTVTLKDVGRKIAVFTAVEMKRQNGGKITADQQQFIDFVRRTGGIAGVARDAEEAKSLIEEFNNRGAT